MEMEAFTVPLVNECGWGVRFFSLSRYLKKGVHYMAGNREFFYRRLHSLLGVIPVGLFLTQHLVVNHFATQGPEAFNRAASFMGNLPFRYFLEIFIIFLPLLFLSLIHI